MNKNTSFSNLVLNVFQKEKLVGVVSFSDNKPQIADVKDERLHQLVKEAQEKGVPLFLSVHKENETVTVKETVTPEHRLFPLAFRDWVQGKGYRVEKDDPQLNTDIATLLQKAKDHPQISSYITEDVLREWESVSYLEKTMLKDSLIALLDNVDN